MTKRVLSWEEDRGEVANVLGTKWDVVSIMREMKAAMRAYACRRQAARTRVCHVADVDVLVERA